MPARYTGVMYYRDHPGTRHRNIYHNQGAAIFGYYRATPLSTFIMIAKRIGRRQCILSPGPATRARTAGRRAPGLAYFWTVFIYHATVNHPRVLWLNLKHDVYCRLICGPVHSASYSPIIAIEEILVNIAGLIRKWREDNTGATIYSNFLKRKNYLDTFYVLFRK